MIITSTKYISIIRLPPQDPPSHIKTGLIRHNQDRLLPYLQEDVSWKPWKRNFTHKHCMRHCRRGVCFIVGEPHRCAEGAHASAGRYVSARQWYDEFFCDYLSARRHQRLMEGKFWLISNWSPGGATHFPEGAMPSTRLDWDPRGVPPTRLDRTGWGGWHSLLCLSLFCNFFPFFSFFFRILILIAQYVCLVLLAFSCL